MQRQVKYDATEKRIEAIVRQVRERKSAAFVIKDFLEGFNHKTLDDLWKSPL